MSAIIIIETSDIGARYTAEAIKNLGYEPIFIFTEANYQADTKSQLLQYQHYHCENTLSKDEILSVIDKAAITDIQGVITLLDSRLPVSCELAQQLGVPGPERTILTLADKGSVAKTIPEYSPPFLIFNQNDNAGEISFDSIQNNAADKFVVKPTKSAGAYGLTFLDRETLNLQSLLDYINSIEKENLKQGDWIIEPKLDGDLISLEGFVHNGLPCYLGFTSRGKISNTESLCEFPINHRIEESLQLLTKQAIDTLIQRTGFQNGYFHTEFIMNKKNAYLIDANFGRIGGGGIAEQIALAYSKNPIEVFQHIISLTLCPHKIDPDFYNVDLVKNTMSINYGVQKNSVITKIEVPNKLLHTLLLDMDTEIPAMGINNWSWLGIAVGYQNDMKNLVEQIELITQDGNKLPAYFLEAKTWQEKKNLISYETMEVFSRFLGSSSQRAYQHPLTSKAEDDFLSKPLGK